MEAHLKGRQVALIVDEAQNMSLIQLEELCILATLEADQKQLLKIVLIGQTELSQILNQQSAFHISKHITSRYHLLALDLKNCNAYIQHRLSVAGTEEKIFSKPAVSKVFELSQGIPRLVDVLCDEALQTTFARRKYQVTTFDVKKASQKVLGYATERRGKANNTQFITKRLCAVLTLFLVLTTVFFWYSGKDSQSSLSTTQQVPVPVVSMPPVTIEEPEPVIQTPPPEIPKSIIRIVPLEINE